VRDPSRVAILALAADPEAQKWGFQGGVETPTSAFLGPRLSIKGKEMAHPGVWPWPQKADRDVGRRAGRRSAVTALSRREVHGAGGSSSPQKPTRSCSRDAHKRLIVA
jgi:hypothetical protein